MVKNRTRARMLVRPKESANNVFQLFIYDDVTGEGSFDWSTWEYIDSKTSADYFREQLAGIPDNGTIELYINSHGGYIDEGTAIYNQLKRHKAYKVGYVDGVAYSVASLILMACDHIIVGLGTSVLVHNMWTVATGNAEDLRKVADDLDKMMESNRQVYMQRFNGSEEELIALMAEERPLTPDECLEMGFCDELGEVIEHKKLDLSNSLENNTTSNESGASQKAEEQIQQFFQMFGAQMNQYTQGMNLASQRVEQVVEQITKNANLDRINIPRQAIPEPQKPEENKCINFFNQFLEEESE